MTTGFTYQPALDGLRAVAVVMVLVFHADLGLLSGGYVGVSVFFTLSGFLITSLLHQEVAGADRVDITAFLARRARRLLPASMVCLLGVAVAARLGLLDGVTNLHRDLLGSLFQVQNWVLLRSGESYTDLLLRHTGRASPLEHYWSLAIEEQFYWVWPIVFGGLAVLARRRIALAVGLLAVASAATAPLIARIWGPDAAYWATPARLSEILLGAWLALVMSTNAGDRRMPARRWWAPVALAVIVVTGAAASSDSAFLYGGGFAVFAVASTLLIAGLQQPGIVTTFLARRPLVLIGRVSYGLYLFHWPVYVVLDEARVGTGGITLFVIRLAVTVAITVVSYTLIERPIRAATFTPGVTFAGAATAVIVVAAGSLMLPPRVDDQYWQVVEIALPSAPEADTPLDIVPIAVVGEPEIEPEPEPELEPEPSPTTEAPAETSAEEGVAGNTPGASPQTRPTDHPALSRPVRILVVGDSVAQATGSGLYAWAGDHPDLATVAVVGYPGFGFLQSGRVADDSDDQFSSPARTLVEEQLPEALAQFRPDVVMLLVTVRDLAARIWSDDEGPLDPLDVRFAERLAEAYTAATEAIRDSGATVAWVRPLPVDPYWLRRGGPNSDSPQRDAYESVLASVVLSFDSGVHLVDLRGWAEATGLSDDIAARPDGLHWHPDASAALAAEWLGPELLRLATGHS